MVSTHKRRFWAKRPDKAAVADSNQTQDRTVILDQTRKVTIDSQEVDTKVMEKTLREYNQRETDNMISRTLERLQKTLVAAVNHNFLF